MRERQREDGRPRHSAHFHHEGHAVGRTSTLRAGVLGANDGLLSTAGLLVGVASASAARSVLVVAGVAALVSGAASMAIGEYGSVSSQRDAEEADLAMEAAELRDGPHAELRELTAIYERRGLDRDLAHVVAEALMEHDALGAHARDELGLDPTDLSRPLAAAVTSAVSFTIGALVPLLVVLLVPGEARFAALICSALLGLAALGALGARLGGASVLRASLRVMLGGAAAMALTAAVGRIFDVAVS
ncbi:MAG: VIT1/CCC1 transporter family protein [Acidimicrobiales bacterium]|nr:VIT1/CCC1 transporter family protein [Acidimicrobiales bacterium]